MNIPNTGQVVGLDHGPVLECMGVANASGITPRDRVQVESVLGECLRRIVYSQELTVEAALSGDRTLVLEAMLTDQMAGRLPYEHVVALTDELLAATAPWLGQFRELTHGLYATWQAVFWRPTNVSRQSRETRASLPREAFSTFPERQR